MLIRREDTLVYCLALTCERGIGYAIFQLIAFGVFCFVITFIDVIHILFL